MHRRRTGRRQPADRDPQPVRASDKVVAEGVVVPALEAALSMPVSGILGEALVAEGDQVAAGQPLLRLQQGRLEAAVAQAEAGVAARPGPTG